MSSSAAQLQQLEALLYSEEKERLIMNNEIKDLYKKYEAKAAVNQALLRETFRNLGEKWLRKNTNIKSILGLKSLPVERLFYPGISDIKYLS